MIFDEDMKAEQEIAIPVRNSLILIKQTVLAYKGDIPELQKLKLQIMELADEAEGRGGSFPMEKLMAHARRTQQKCSHPDVVAFFEGLLEHMAIVTDGIQQIVERNLGLVGHIINSFDDKGNYSREDRLQDGNTGLIKAAYRFEPVRNIKFSTYASWWIKQEARLGFMSMAKTIRWPSNVYQAMGKDRDTFISSMGKNGEAVFAATGREPLSIDIPCSDTNSEPLVNYLKSSYSIPVDDVVSNREIATIVENYIDSQLTEREALVIRARYGIDQKSDRILADVGLELDVSPERIRMIQKKAISKLKKFINISMLKENYA